MFCSRIQEKQTKLWHTVFYENELKLKQLYIKICCNLPSHGCRVYRVKQLLNERNTNRTVSRLSSLIDLSKWFQSQIVRSFNSEKFFNSLRNERTTRIEKSSLATNGFRREKARYSFTCIYFPVFFLLHLSELPEPDTVMISVLDVS